MKLWDTAGQERFRSVTRSYYRGAAGCLLIYDVTSRPSFAALGRWLADVRALGAKGVEVVVVGCKVDREEEREVPSLEASRWAEENVRPSIRSPSLNAALAFANLSLPPPPGFAGWDAQGVLHLETSSLTPHQPHLPFMLVARAIVLSIESGALDPEQAGSGVAYGERQLRSWGASAGGAKGKGGKKGGGKAGGGVGVELSELVGDGRGAENAKGGRGRCC